VTGPPRSWRSALTRSVPSTPSSTLKVYGVQLTSSHAVTVGISLSETVKLHPASSRCIVVVNLYKRHFYFIWTQKWVPINQALTTLFLLLFLGLRLSDFRSTKAFSFHNRSSLHFAYRLKTIFSTIAPDVQVRS